MSRVEELISRVSQLEETVNHLTTHHDEQFLIVHDDVTRDTCDRLFNVNLQQRKSTTSSRKRRTKASAK